MLMRPTVTRSPSGSARPLAAPVCAALASLLALGGCGLRGDLERPPPLAGPDTRQEDADKDLSESKARAERERLARLADRAEAQAQSDAAEPASK